MIMTPNAFSKYLNDDIAKWAKVVKLSGAKELKVSDTKVKPLLLCGSGLQKIAGGAG